MKAGSIPLPHRVFSGLYRRFLAMAMVGQAGFCYIASRKKRLVPIPFGSIICIRFNGYNLSLLQKRWRWAPPLGKHCSCFRRQIYAFISFLSAFSARNSHTFRLFCANFVTGQARKPPCRTCFCPYFQKTFSLSESRNNACIDYAERRKRRMKFKGITDDTDGRRGRKGPGVKNIS